MDNVKNKINVMQILDKILLQNAMFNEGIVPFDTSRTNVNTALQSVTPDEARKMKRKFRKMWRKLARAANTRDKVRMGFKNTFNDSTGKTSALRTRQIKEQNRCRKSAVLMDMVVKHVAPVKNEMEDSVLNIR